MSQMPFESAPESEIEPSEIRLESHDAMKEADALPEPKSSSSSKSEASDTAAPKWRVVTAKARVDSFNQEALIQEIRDARAGGGTRLALDLRPNRFLSLPVIRFCVDVSHELADIGGSFVLIGCSEKTKRHFEIYGTLDDIRVVRSEVDLDRAKRPRDV